MTLVTANRTPESRPLATVSHPINFAILYASAADGALLVYLALHDLIITGDAGSQACMQ